MKGLLVKSVPSGFAKKLDNPDEPLDLSGQIIERRPGWK